MTDKERLTRAIADHVLDIQRMCQCLIDSDGTGAVTASVRSGQSSIRLMSLIDELFPEESND